MMLDKLLGLVFVPPARPWSSPIACLIVLILRLELDEKLEVGPSRVSPGFMFWTMHPCRTPSGSETVDLRLRWNHPDGGSSGGRS